MLDPSRFRYLASPLAVVALALIHASPALACWNSDREAAADSPAWWTLNEETTPEELRRRCLDIEENRLRYREAVQRGHALDLQNDLSGLVFFVDGSRTPELVPAWQAFASFARDLARWPDPATEVATRELANRGLDLASIYDVLEIAEQRNLRATALEEEVEDDFMRLEALSAMARKEGEFAAFKAAVKAGDRAALVLQTGATTEEIERGLGARYRRPEEASAIEAIVALRSLLDDAGWAALRGFLLEKVAGGLQGVGFEMQVEQ